MSQKCHSILIDRNGRRSGDVASVSHNFTSAHFIAEHFHPEHQLIFASSGVMTVSTTHGIWVVPPLRAVWIPANTPHSVEISATLSMRTLYFRPNLVRALPPKCFVMNVSPLLRELILHACKFPRLNTRIPIQNGTIDLVVAQLESAHSIPVQLPHPSDSRAMRVAGTLLNDPGDQRTLTKLCGSCGASKRTIERIFLAETGITFNRWRQQLRLLRAIQMIAGGEKVTLAALEVGYASPSAFIAMFRRQFGQTPARYFHS